MARQQGIENRKQGEENRRHNRLSAKPILDFTYSMRIPGKAPSITIQNKGFGPAIITRIEMIVGKERFDATDFREMDKGIAAAIKILAAQPEIIKSPIENMKLTALLRNDVIRAGEDQVLVVAGRDQSLDQDAIRFISYIIWEIVFYVEYDSIYEEKFNHRSQSV